MSRDAALIATLEHAARNVPYYRRRWGSRWKKVRTAADLWRLPFLTKPEAIAHQRELLAVRTPAFSGVVSSGTVHGGGPPLRVLHTPEEERARLDALPKGQPGRPSRDLVLEVRTVHHGLPEGAPPPGRLCVPWTDTANGLHSLEQLLAVRHADGRRVTALVIGAAPLAVLTTWLLERGVRPSRFSVRAIGTYGFRISPHWTQLVEQAWRAKVFDNYSLSELSTSALPCGTCGRHHWLHPAPLFEVVDAFTRRPLKSGTGVMVLTGLYPFVQAMPLVRYWTGDLVELGPKCRVAGARGFTFRGREASSVVQRGTRPGAPRLVSGQDVGHFLDARAEVQRVPHAAHGLGLISADVGPPRFALLLDRGKPVVRVHLRFPPLLFAGAAEALSDALRARFPTVRVELESSVP